MVIAGPPTYHGTDPGVVRLQNVGDLGFEIRFQEWDYRARDFADSAHLPEDIPYVILQPGRHVMSDGSVWEVGTFDLAGTRTWQEVFFTAPFSAVPHLYLTMQTSNEPDAVAVRARDLTVDGFQAALYEEEALDDGHFDETVGYLAIYSPAAGGSLDLDGLQVPYLLQTFSTDERWTPLLSQRIKLEEEQSKDGELDHVDETLHALALGSQVFAQQVSNNGFDPTALRRLEPTAEAPMEWGLVRGIDHNWQTLPFAKRYVDPILVAKPASNLGGDPGVIRIQGVETDHARLRYQEWSYLDHEHLPEAVFYLVSEAGEHRLGGLTVEADWRASNRLGRAGQWEDISFAALFTVDPVVLAGVMTYYGADPVISRISNLAPSGFELTMDEQESKSDGHLTELLGWIAIEPGAGTTAEGRTLQVFFEQIDHNLTRVEYPTATQHRYPTTLADVNSSFAPDPVFLRYANPTSAQIELQLTTELSEDTEATHVLEDVGVFVAE